MVENNKIKVIEEHCKRLKKTAKPSLGTSRIIS
jgi:hypothetical protein